MRALAEFIMRGRLQASSVAMLGYVIPLLTPLVVALVTLRRGAYEGTLILSISLIPALLSVVINGGSPLLIWITLLSLIIVFIPALVLRATVSMSLAVVSATVVSIMISGLAMLVATEQIDELIVVLHKGLAAQEGNQPLADVVVTHLAVAGLISYILVANSVSGLFLGRWMQALLYNPGGFGSEFRDFRLSPVAAGFCFIGSLGFFLKGAEYWWWSNTLSLPLMLVAVAIAHSVVKHRELASFWLVLCYMAVFFIGPVMVLIGLLDTWLNFRGRLQKK